jgi:hypothetical protein
MASCIMTIHQPPASVLAQFDKLLLLSRRGELVYFGPTHQVQQYMCEWVGLPKPHKVSCSLALHSHTLHVIFVV